MAKKDTRRKYTREFKLKVVKEHLGGASLTELSKIYDIAPSTLGTWFSTMKEEASATLEEEKKAENISTRQLEELNNEVTTLKSLLETKDAEISRLNSLLSTLQSNYNGESIPTDTLELIESKDREISRLEAEVVKLHELVLMIKEEARREINTLKDAIVIMVKNYDEE